MTRGKLGENLAWLFRAAINPDTASHSSLSFFKKRLYYTCLALPNWGGEMMGQYLEENERLRGILVEWSTRATKVQISFLFFLPSDNGYIDATWCVEAWASIGARAIVKSRPAKEACNKKSNKCIIWKRYSLISLEFFHCCLSYLRSFWFISIMEVRPLRQKASRFQLYRNRWLNVYNRNLRKPIEEANYLKISVVEIIRRKVAMLE